MVTQIGLSSCIRHVAFHHDFPGGLVRTQRVSSVISFNVFTTEYACGKSCTTPQEEKRWSVLTVSPRKLALMTCNTQGCLEIEGLTASYTIVGLMALHGLQSVFLKKCSQYFQSRLPEKMRLRIRKIFLSHSTRQVGFNASVA